MRRITQIMAVFFLVLAGAPPAQADEIMVAPNVVDINDRFNLSKVVAQVDPCLNPNLQSVLQAIETCRTAPDPLKCVADLPDANQKAYYGRLCRVIKPAAEFTNYDSIGSSLREGGAFGIRANEYLAKEADGGTGGEDGMVAREAANLPVAIFVPDPPLEPCACLEQLKELMKNKETGEVPECIQSCPPPPEEVPPPVLDPPVEEPKAQVPVADPFRPDLGVRGNKLCGSIPVAGVGDIGWLVLFLPSLPFLFKGIRRRP